MSNPIPEKTGLNVLDEVQIILNKWQFNQIDYTTAIDEIARLTEIESEILHE